MSDAARIGTIPVSEHTLQKSIFPIKLFTVNFSMPTEAVEGEKRTLICSTA